ncbi:acyltransferase family protein [Kitasatospora sp. NPDC058444]|uniref:acyltransferase family protein n=1 Tax=Kitasatospora sp. NPDC058444 TaxID=3346504 RepID=UPI003662E12C
MNVRSAPPTKKAPRAPGLPSLTGLRFLAAMAVFLYHVTNPQLTPFGGESARLAGRLFGVAGGLGVAFFFILSGFILAWSARPHDAPRRFLRRRLVKLYPNHLVTFVLALVVFAGATGWETWLPNILLVQTWSWDPAVSFGVNGPSWSLGCELFFYACFPLLYRWIRRIDPKHLWAWACGFAAAVMALPAFAYAALAGGPPMPGLPVNAVQSWFVYQLPPVRMLEFVLGMLLARIVLTDRWIGVRIHHALALCAVGYAAALNVPFLYTLSATWAIPVGLLIPAVAVADVRGHRSPFRGRVMTWLGEVSFAFYLLQASVLTGGAVHLADRRPFGWAAALGLCLLAWALTLALAHALYLLVERPAMKRWSRPRSAGRHDTRTAPAAEDATFRVGAG